MPGEPGVGALEGAAREYDVRPHQGAEKVDHGRMPDQFGGRAAQPLDLRYRTGQIVAVGSWLHRYIGEFRFELGDAAGVQHVGQDDVAFGLEVADPLRVGEGAEVGAVDVHEGDDLIGVDCGDGGRVHWIPPW